jgi:hypothetical protein
MSLINDALKKAARLRAQEQADLIPPMPGGGGRVSRQKEPVRTQTIVLIAGAAVALVVVSAVITGILVTGRPETKAEPEAKHAQVEAPARPAMKVVVQAPPITVTLPKPVVASPSPTPTPAPTAPPPVKAAPAAPATVALPIVRSEESPPAAVRAAPAPQTRNELIQGVVDRFHISGVRSAGPDSKALIDGHVYKVNEVIDRSVGLKLVGVAPDQLTFVDADGGTYVKSF